MTMQHNKGLLLLANPSMNRLTMSVPGLSPLEPHGAFRAVIGLILKLVAMDPFMALHVINAGKLLGALGASMGFEV